MSKQRVVGVLALALAVVAAPAFAQKVIYKDPIGDDNGPGTYSYPTDQVYIPGSFDLTQLELNVKGNKANMKVSVNSSLQDPWRMEVGFAVQMIFVFIDTDGEAGSGHSDGLPGTNVKFAEGHEWDKCIILSPQSSSRVKQEVRTKAGAMAGDIIVPSRVSGSGKAISTSVKVEDVGGDPASWGIQVVMQSNEGFPAKTDLLTRKVNEFEGQHRFGGGTDYDCDPHVMDILAGEANGDSSEVEAQHAMLAYECDDEGNATKMATLEMIRR
jgi:carbohydrate-binding DOMON domain-containing protein